jgi:hypothetical protein
MWKRRWPTGGRATRTGARAENQQQKLIEARYADAIPLDLLKSEQDRIGRELAGAEQIIERYSAEVTAVMRVVDEVLLHCADAHQLYLSAPPQIKRQLNQAVFKRFWIVDNGVADAELAEPFTLFLADGFTANLKSTVATVSSNPAPRQQPPWKHRTRPLTGFEHHYSGGPLGVLLEPARLAAGARARTFDARPRRRCRSYRA